MRTLAVSNFGDAIIRGISVNSEIAAKNDQIKKVLKYFREAIRLEKENQEFQVVVRNEVKLAYRMLIEYEAFLKWLSEEGYGQHPKLEPGKRDFHNLKKLYLQQAKRFTDLIIPKQTVLTF